MYMNPPQNYQQRRQQQQQQQYQDNNMNLLISPFEPDQFEYNALGNTKQEIKLGYPSSTQPLDVPMLQQNQYNQSIDFDILNTNNMSSSAMSCNSLPVPSGNNTSLFNQSPSPRIDMMNNLSNDFISRSPESSSSTDSNLVSPPQQYYPSSDFTSSWSMNNGTYNNNSAARRSSSVPPHFHGLKFQQGDSMCTQFQSAAATPPHPVAKPLPIQIQRVQPSSHHNNRPINSETHRRKLDEKLEKVNFDDITVAELKEMLRERGLSATGRKAELMNKLKEEYEALIRRGGSTVPPVVASSAPQHQPLHRRVANLNLTESPKRQHHQYFPYSPPPSRAAINFEHHRLASSVPDTHTQSYLNDQFMMKKKPSCLRKSIDDDQDWTKSYNMTPFSFNANTFASTSPVNNCYQPSVAKIEESVMSNFAPNNAELWDEQALQNFLNTI